MTQAHERTATLSQLTGKQIKLQLFLREMSGRDLAGKLGVSPSWVSYRLSGKQEIGLDDLFRIAKALDVELTEILTPEIVARATEGPRNTHGYSTVTDHLPAHTYPERGNRPPGRPSGATRPGVSRTAYVDRADRRRRDR